MELVKLNNYKVNESDILTDSDKKHITNYQQLIKFFENAIQSSISNEGVNYLSLHNSCLQSIRFLDNLILSYESSLQNARNINQTIDKIIADHSDVGNEEKEETST